MNYLILIICIILVLILLYLNSYEKFETEVTNPIENTSTTINLLDMNKIEKNNDIIFSDKNTLDNNIELFFKTYYTIIDIDKLNNILKNDFNITETFNSIYSKYKWSRHYLLEFVDIIYFSYDNLDNKVIQLKCLGDFIRLNLLDQKTSGFFINYDNKETGDIFVYYNNKSFINNLSYLKTYNINGEKDINLYLYNFIAKQEYPDLFNQCMNEKILCKSNITVIQREFLFRVLGLSADTLKEFDNILDNKIILIKQNKNLIMEFFENFTLMMLIRLSLIEGYNTYISYNKINYYSNIANELTSTDLKEFTKDDLDFLNKLKNDFTLLEKNEKYITIINNLNNLVRNNSLIYNNILLQTDFHNSRNDLNNITDIINNLNSI